jgi:exopolysaccharide biosynthesis predicted pyruvyltransferase EpsI
MNISLIDHKQGLLGNLGDYYKLYNAFYEGNIISNLPDWKNVALIPVVYFH